MRKFREVPELLGMLSDLNKRVGALETSRRLGNASIDAGELNIVGGNLNVRSDAGNLVTSMHHGNIPTIQYFPGDNPNPTRRTSMFAWQAGDGAALQLSCEISAGDTQSGGKLLLLPNGLYLALQRPSKPEVYISMAQNSSYDEHFRFQGRWIADNQFGDNDAIIFGIANVGAGFGAAGIAFTYPFDTTPIVLYSLFNSGTAVAHDLSTLDNTGFTVAWATGTTAKIITWAAFRV